MGQLRCLRGALSWGSRVVAEELPSEFVRAFTGARGFTGARCFTFAMASLLGVLAAVPNSAVSNATMAAELRSGPEAHAEAASPLAGQPVDVAQTPTPPESYWVWQPTGEGSAQPDRWFEQRLPRWTVREERQHRLRRFRVQKAAVLDDQSVELTCSSEEQTEMVAAGAWVARVADFAKLNLGPKLVGDANAVPAADNRSSAGAESGEPLVEVAAADATRWIWDRTAWGPPPSEDSFLPWVLVTEEQPWLLVQDELRPAGQTRQKFLWENVYGKGAPDFNGVPQGVDLWMPDGESYLQRREGEWWLVAARTGSAERWYRSSDIAKPIAEKLGIESRAAQELANFQTQQLHPATRRAWFSWDGELYWIALDGGAPQLVFRHANEAELVEFSPDGEKIAFVAGNNLHVYHIADQELRQLTQDGGALIRNGKADWVYFEEVNMRDWKNYRWSPDSRQIIFLRLDDTGVKNFTIAVDLKVVQSLETERYPLAGQPNPVVNVAIADVRTGKLQWAEFQPTNYSPDQLLITKFGWAGAQKAYVCAQDRAQRWLDLWFWSAGTPAQRILRQETPAWVEPPLGPFLLGDGTFLMTDERSGWKHLYHYRPDGTVVRPVTSGEWEVRSVPRFDEETGWVYLTGSQDSPLADQFYRVRWQGESFERLTKTSSAHHVQLAPRGDLFVDRQSQIDDPDRIALVSCEQGTVRMLDSNPIPVRATFEWPPLQLIKIPTRDGGEMEASLTYPTDYDRNRSYPVWIMTYGGPHAPMLSQSWAGGRLTERLLAERGVVVCSVDPRSASGKGAASAWRAYRKLGTVELADLEDAVDWLVAQKIADPERIGLSGHSYGGYLTAYALTHSKKFAAGIAGAPVTSWANYDSIYTERYMDLPQNNPVGYETSSVVAAAGQLHGKLLLIHGGLDDNVHIANTWQFVHALQTANRDFQLMVYPEHRHGIWGDHYRRLRFDFMCDTLGVPRPVR